MNKLHFRNCLGLSIVLSLFFSISGFTACDVCPNAKVIFVNNSNSSPGTGTYADPYSDLLNALSNADPCDVIYVFPTTTPYDGLGITFQLQPNQRLLGTTSEAYQRCPNNCDLPTLQNTGGQVVIQLADNNEISGFNITTDPNADVDIQTYGIGGNVLVIPLPITNALITNNNFTTYRNGVCAGAANCTQLGNFIVKNCAFFAGDNGELGTATWGILISACENGSLQVSDSLFTGVDATQGLFLPIASLTFAGPLTYSIQRNTIICSSHSVTGIGIDATMGGFGNQSGNITDNFVQVPNAGGPVNHVGGIACINRTLSDSFCFSLSNNIVTTAPDIAGIFIWNSSTGAFKLDFDNSNTGSISINVPNEHVVSPPDTAMFNHVTLAPSTSGCPQ